MLWGAKIYGLYTQLTIKYNVCVCSLKYCHNILPKPKLPPNLVEVFLESTSNFLLSLHK